MTFWLIFKEIPVTLQNIINLHLSNPLIYVIDTAPAFLGLFAFVAGVNYAKSEINRRILESLAADLRKSEQELTNEIKARIVMEKKIRKLAFYDYLTDLPNRRLFNERLERAIQVASRNGKPLVVLFLDLDSFKMVNDTMGHAQGDELLKEVAERLKSSLRKSDTVARIGGDEFLIIIQNIGDKQAVEVCLDKIISKFKEPFNLNNYELYITPSIGVVVYPTDGENTETLIKNADIAMYKAKERGGNSFEFCTPFLKNSVIEEMKLANDLYRALERNELEVFYQPQVKAKSGEIIGLEALVRWNNRELGLLNPEGFIAITERTGLIIPIGEWVARTACAQNKTWQDEGLANIPVAVNLSVNQLQNPKMVEQIIAILNETGLNPKYLDLEISESAGMKEPGAVLETLKQLKNLGVSISIDDFGTKYSSLFYLKQLPIDKIKIAMCFIQGINVSDTDEAIIKAIITLAKTLGLSIIAEGVETREQLEFLGKQGCDDIQGYYFYKPMPKKAIEEIMKKNQTR
jgi:diguanylate cyclase (GGDEF)-like protein